MSVSVCLREKELSLWLGVSNMLPSRCLTIMQSAKGDVACATVEVGLVYRLHYRLDCQISSRSVRNAFTFGPDLRILDCLLDQHCNAFFCKQLSRKSSLLIYS